MENLTLRQLRYFDAMARHRHFGQAAAACSISQPAMSIQIRDLEESLGAALFERGARQVRLTVFGEKMLAQTLQILASVDALKTLARASAGATLNQLRIGIIPTIAPYLLPALIGRLTAHYPGLDLHVRETLTPKLLSELGEGRLDAAILALPVSEPSLTETALFDEEFVLVRPVQDAHKPLPDGDALRKMRLLLLEEGHCFRDQALSFCNIHSAMPREGLDGSSLTTLVQMVGAGLGVTLIPDMAVAVETRTDKVAVARFRKPPPSRTIGIVWRKTNPLETHLRGVAQQVRLVGEALRPRPQDT